MVKALRRKNVFANRVTKGSWHLSIFWLILFYINAYKFATKEAAFKRKQFP